MKKIISSILVLSILLFGSVAFAADSSNENPLNPLPLDQYAESELYENFFRAAGVIIKAQSFMAVDGRTVQAKGTQTANAQCDKIGAYFTLQKKNGSSWENYRTASSYLSDRSSSVVVVTFSFVASGEYRIVASHRAYSGSTIKSSITTTTTSLKVS